MGCIYASESLLFSKAGYHDIAILLLNLGVF